MIVDDEPLMRRVLGIAMDRFGIAAQTFAGGAAGLEMIRRAPQEVDVVLLDLLMPGMSGMEVLEELQRLPHPPKVILMTGFSENDDVATARALGARAIIHKPFDLDEVIRRIEEVGLEPHSHPHPVAPAPAPAPATAPSSQVSLSRVQSPDRWN